ncbi:MAG: lytic murein transglycosylase [Pseudomonadota bacterium]
MTTSRLARVAVALTLALAPPATAQDKSLIQKEFRAWLDQDIWPEAHARGVSRPTFDTATAGLSLNWDLPDLVPPGTEAAPPRRNFQAEFRSPARYFRHAASDASIGRVLMQKHGVLLDVLKAETGVPGHVLLAIWGRESAFGRAAIPHDAFEVLGTKAFMSRRADVFRAEFLAALEIAQAGHAPGDVLRSSWAGALGQPQFLPSSYLRHARDGDGDGRADIWTSAPDTLASIAAYLAGHGWIAGRDWGFEVHVPADVPCTLEGPDQGRPIADWQAMGVTRVNGRPFPAHELTGEGYLMMPAGRFGPAFVVTPNFYVLKDYNMSDLYALYIGNVGDRIAYGMGDFTTQFAGTHALTRGDVAHMQETLVRQGHDVGGVDGLAGFKTRRAIGRWQVAEGQSATCFPDKDLKAALK